MNIKRQCSEHMRRNTLFTSFPLVFISLVCVQLTFCKSQKIEKEEEENIPATISAVKKYIEYERSDSDNIKRIYLTFDDGPYTTTPQLTTLLKNKKIRASFFIIGSQITSSKAHDSIFRATLLYDSFKVYNHTYTHAVTKGRIHNYYKDPGAVWADIDSNKRFLPKSPFITRLPGKNTWRTPAKTTIVDAETKRLIDLLDSTSKNEQLIGWDVEWTGKTNTGYDQVTALINKIEVKLEKSLATNKDVVILLHDYLFKTENDLNLLGGFIDHFKNRGDVKFDWVHNLPAVGKQNN